MLKLEFDFKKVSANVGKNWIAREFAEILNDTTYVAGHLRGRARVEN